VLRFALRRQVGRNRRTLRSEVVPMPAIMASILGLSLFGDGLRDLLDRKLRGVQGGGREA
jgi:ABC-type dipeptide/oligopeptide/nickel transport system permease subunit